VVVGNATVADQVTNAYNSNQILLNAAIKDAVDPNLVTGSSSARVALTSSNEITHLKNYIIIQFKVHFTTKSITF